MQLHLFICLFKSGILLTPLSFLVFKPNIDIIIRGMANSPNYFNKSVTQGEITFVPPWSPKDVKHKVSTSLTP
jgi:hypothetical protein